MAANQLLGAQELGFLPASPNAGRGTIALNAAGTWLALGFVSEQAKTLKSIRVFCATNTGAAASDLTCDIYSDASGTPVASLAGPATSSTTPASNTWLQFGGSLGASGFNLALTAGTQYWIVLKNANASPGTVNATFGWMDKGTIPTGPGGAAFGSFGWAKRSTTNSGSTWGSAAGDACGWRLDFSDGTFAGFPVSNIAASADKAFGTQESGVKFTVPPGATWNVRGVRMAIGFLGTPTGDLRFRLYTGSGSAVGTNLTLVDTTLAVPHGGVLAGASGYYSAYFPAMHALAPGTVVRITAGDTAADSSANCYRLPYEYTFDADANSQALIPIQQTLQKTVTTDGVNFTETSDAFSPAGLILDTTAPFASGAAPAAGDIRLSVVINGVTGTLVVPSADDLRDSVGAGAGGTEVVGNIVVPSPDVLLVGSGAGSGGTEVLGDVVLPDVSNVASSVTYGPNSTLTGTLTTTSVTLAQLKAELDARHVDTAHLDNLDVAVGTRFPTASAPANFGATQINASGVLLAQPCDSAGTVLVVADTVQADLAAISGSTPAAANLKSEMLAMVGGSVAASPTPTATTFAATGASLSSTNGFYSTPGSMLVFTTGAMAGKAAKVTGYTGATKTFTFANGFPAAPAASDQFILLGLAQ